MKSFPLSFALAATALLAAGSARAQSAVGDSNWRQDDRHDALLAVGSPQHFAFEVRFGAYSPNIDNESFGGLPAYKKPYASVFGDHCPNADGTPCKPGQTHPQFYFGLEFDYLPVRIPFVGALGIGYGWGFTTTSANAVFTEGPSKGQLSGETTSLTIMPMHLSLVLRADELMRRTGIPIVPYGKAGFGLAYWRATTDAGTEVYTNASKVAISANGLTPSLNFAVGGMLCLNFIDPRAASNLDEATGVNHAYVFGEFVTNAKDFGANVMHVGTTTWALGLAMDM